MFDPEALEPDYDGQLGDLSLGAEPSPEQPFPAFDPFKVLQPPADAAEIFTRDIPPDNEHGDGVRNPAVRPCAGIKGTSLLTPKIFVKSEDWRDYNYSDFNY